MILYYNEDFQKTLKIQKYFESIEQYFIYLGLNQNLFALMD
jgi:hypothetical protein